MVSIQRVFLVTIFKLKSRFDFFFFLSPGRNWRLI